MKNPGNISLALIEKLKVGVWYPAQSPLWDGVKIVLVVSFSTSLASSGDRGRSYGEVTVTYKDDKSPTPKRATFNTTNKPAHIYVGSATLSHDENSKLVKHLNIDNKANIDWGAKKSPPKTRFQQILQKRKDDRT